MNKQFFRHLSLFIPTIALFSSVNAQIERPGPEFNPKDFVFTESSAQSFFAGEDNTANINAKALKDFAKNFKTAGKTNWFEIKKGFLASFEAGGIKTRVFYDEKGRWSATVRTYGQDMLPQDIRKLVRSSYYDYTIFQVNEITVGDKIAYLVGIQDPENVKTIRVTEDGMDVYEDFTKA